MGDPARRLQAATGVGGSGRRKGGSRRKPPVAFSVEELRALLDAITGPQRLRDVALVTTTYHQAWRGSEACQATVGNVDWSRMLFTVYRRKTDDWIEQAIHPQAARELQAYLHARRLAARTIALEPGAPLFESLRGGPLTRNGFWRLLKKWGACAGLPAHKCRTHTLRHSKAQAMRRAGANLEDIQAWLGHSSIAVTADFYLHASDEEVSAAAFADVL